jgi:signal peptidase I
VENGDRILVGKCFYQFFQPKRWDVIVFKNPLNPSENYIKRLIGLPEEEVEIIDGDIYINGRIQRKPPKVQNELWMPIYDNDYQPVRSREGSFNGRFWRQPFTNVDGSKWIIPKNEPTLFCLDCPAGKINTMFYDTSEQSSANDFRAAYAYDDARGYGRLPYCSDLLVRFYVTPGQQQGQIGAELGKYGISYRAWVDLYESKAYIARLSNGQETILEDSWSLPETVLEKPSLLKFANVDHKLILQFGNEKLTYDLGDGAKDAGDRRTHIEPEVKIFGAGKLKISHVAVFRDIHYIETGSPNRAAEGNPFPLRKDEFFALGDNSPNSQDSRLWNSKGLGNNGRRYRAGIVPRDYLLGKAVFVYWPGGFRFPWPDRLRNYLLDSSRNSRLSRIMYWMVSLKWIPNIGQMRFIYGGSNSEAPPIS